MIGALTKHSVFLIHFNLLGVVDNNECRVGEEDIVTMEQLLRHFTAVACWRSANCKEVTMPDLTIRRTVG